MLLTLKICDDLFNHVMIDLNFLKYDMSDCWNGGLLEWRIVGMADCWNGGLLEWRIVGMADCWNGGLLEWRISSL